MIKYFKAKVIATGEIVDVKAWKGASDVFFSTPDMNQFYQASEIEIIVEPIVMLTQLKNVLNQAVEAGYINEYGAHRIIDLTKEHLKK